MMDVDKYMHAHPYTGLAVLYAHLADVETEPRMVDTYTHLADSWAKDANALYKALATMPT